MDNNMKVFNLFKDITRTSRAVLGARLKNRPFILSHLITSLCNADCPMCLWKGEGEGLTTGEIRDLYAQAGRLGFLSVVVWGGEPLLRQDIGEVLECARHSGLRTTVITNGYLLPEKAEEIGRHLHTLLVSIDAPSGYHDTLRRLPGTFHRAMEGIKLLRSLQKDLKVVVISVITRQNLEYVGPLLEFSKKNSLPIIFQAINIRDYGLRPRNIDTQDVCPSQKENLRVFGLIADCKRRGFPVVNSYEYLNALAKGETSYKCHYKKLTLRVETNGDVLDCTEGPALPSKVEAGGEGIIGNVKEKCLEDIIASPQYERFLNNTGYCSVCMDAGTLESSYLWELRPPSLLNGLRVYRDL